MSSRRALRRKACSGKIRHASMGAAWIAAMKTDGGVRPYKCRHCPGYHIGHSTHQAKMRRQNGHG
jgi:hypothetical protein